MSEDLPKGLFALLTMKGRGPGRDKGPDRSHALPSRGEASGRGVDCKVDGQQDDSRARLRRDDESKKHGVRRGRILRFV